MLTFKVLQVIQYCSFMAHFKDKKYLLIPVKISASQMTIVKKFFMAVLFVTFYIASIFLLFNMNPKSTIQDFRWSGASFENQCWFYGRDR